MRKALAAIAATIGAVLALTACSPDYAPGPTGPVTDRSATYRSATYRSATYRSATYRKADGWHYQLTVTTTDGRREDFRVTRDDYRHCFRGSAYPTCTHR